MIELDRYIARDILIGTLLTDLALALLVTFFTFTDELKSLGQGSYGLLEIAEYLLLVTPGHAVTLLPSAALVGSLVVLGALAENKELLAMQVSGYSRNRIVLVVLGSGLVLSAASLAMGEYVVPVLDRSADVHKSLHQKQEVTLHSRYGLWVRQGNMFANVRSITDKSSIQDILIYDLAADGGLISATHAQSAEYIDGQWALRDIQRSRISPESVLTEHKDDEPWNTSITPDFFDTLLAQPDSLSIEDLSIYISHLKKNGLRDREAELAFWSRVFTPLATETMLLLTLPFVLVSQRAVNLGQRIVIGVALGLGFYLIDRTVGHLGLIYGFPPWATAAAPALVCLAGVAVGLARPPYR